MQEGTIVFVIDERPLSLRPPHQFDYIARMVSAAMYEPLLVAPGPYGKLVPGAARAWKTECGGREYLFVLAKAVDRAGIANALHGGLIPADYYGSDYLPATSPVPRFDPAEAKRLRDQAPLLRRPLRMRFHDYYPNQQVAAMIGNQWLRLLGIETRLLPVTFAVAA